MKNIVKGALIALFLASVHAQAARKRQAAPELWQGMKKTVVLPVKNEAAEGGQELADKVGAVLKQALSDSKKFSLESVHLFNPTIQRALRESRGISEQNVQAAVATPTLSNVQAVAQGLKWDFMVEATVKDYKATTANNVIVAEITLDARLYDVASGQPVKQVVVNAKGTPRKKKKPTVEDAQDPAVAQVVGKVVDEFLGRNLPAPEPPKEGAAPSADKPKQ
jgi:hypothetical protein